MSRRFVGNRGDLLSALGAAPITRRAAARRVRSLVQRDENARRNGVEQENGAARAAPAAPVRKRQRLETGSRTTTTTKTRPVMATTRRKSRDLRFSTRSYATEHTSSPPQRPLLSHQLDTEPKPSRQTTRYDPSVELKHYTGSRAHPEIQAVLRGHISLETARAHRLQNLMALLNNIDQVARQLREEDMAGDPTALQARMAAFLAAREQMVDMWRQAARARQQQQQQRHLVDDHDDPDTAMVHPAHVPGRRMGPAESEPQWRELDRLVQEQAATFEVRLLPVRHRRAALTATTTPGSFGAVHHHHHHHHQQQQQQQQQQTRLFSTYRPPPLAIAIRPFQRSRSFFLTTTAVSAVHSTNNSRAKTATTTTTEPEPSQAPKPKSKLDPSTTTQTIPVPKPKPKHRPRLISRSTPPRSNNAKPNSTAPAPAWLIQKRALAAKFGSEGWSPRRKLSPDAMLHLRALHAANPQLYTTALLASTFKQSPEAIRRILKSKWLSEASTDAVQARRERWARRHDRIWDVKSELGLRPKRKAKRKVEDPSVAAERVEGEIWAGEVLRKARQEEAGGI